VNAGAEQGFIGVDVPEAADEFLVEKQGFHARLALAQELDEGFEIDVEGIGSQLGYAAGQYLADFHAAELAAVFVLKNAPVKREDDVRMLRQRRVDEELAGHTQMDEQEAAGREAENEEFSVAFDGVDGPALQEGGAVVGVAVEDARLAEFGIQDLASGEGLQAADDGFYFG
jgi:hypothetical protein